MNSLLIILGLYTCINDISSNNDHCPCPKIPTHDPYGIALAIGICRAVNKCDRKLGKMKSLDVQDSSVSMVSISAVSNLMWFVNLQKGDPPSQNHQLSLCSIQCFS